MQLTERHVIDYRDPRYRVIDAAAFASKNLYNATLYELRQTFFANGTYLSYSELDKHMHLHEAYKALPAKVSQQVLMQVNHDWDSFFKAHAAYTENPLKFYGRPRLPHYKHKTRGRNLLVYTMQAVSRGKRSLHRGLINPSQLALRSRRNKIQQVLIRCVSCPEMGFTSLRLSTKRQ